MATKTDKTKGSTAPTPTCGGCAAVATAAKPKISTCSLAGCFGCHMSILDIDERILKLIELVDFDKSPIDDLKKFTGRCRVGLIEGGCCNQENVKTLEDFRRHCDLIVALGDCAIMGGLPAMRNGIPLEECLREAYQEGPTVHNPSRQIPNDPELPLILDKVYPIKDIVKVDAFLPGCPPPADAIWEALVALLNNKPVELSYEMLKYD